MKKNYLDLEMASYVDSQAIIRQDSSISKINSSVLNKTLENKNNCKNACNNYGWVGGFVLLTTGVLVGGLYLFNFLLEA